MLIETISGNFSFIQLLKKRNDNNLFNDVQSLKENHVKVNYYFGENEDEVKDLLKVGIDFILTNHLEETLEIAESIGISPMTYNNMK